MFAIYQQIKALNRRLLISIPYCTYTSSKWSSTPSSKTLKITSPLFFYLDIGNIYPIPKAILYLVCLYWSRWKGRIQLGLMFIYCPLKIDNQKICGVFILAEIFFKDIAQCYSNKLIKWSMLSTYLDKCLMHM